MDVAHLTLDDPRWSDALRRLPHDFYHRPEYVGLDADWNGARPQAFLARSGDEQLFIPYLLRRCEGLEPEPSHREPVYDVVSPYGYPGLLLSEAARRSPRFARGAVRALSETLRDMRVCSAFFRMHPLLGRDIPALFPEGFFTPGGETVAMDLTLDDRALWKAVREGHQWTIKKCTRLGFEARMVPLREHLETFMEIYRDTMNRVRARESYYFGPDYFARLADMPEGVHCGVVQWQGRTAAACIFFECGGLVQAHLGGTRSEFLSRSPFHLLLYFAAEWAQSRGNRYLHLGGGVGGSRDRLLHFKRGFSPLLFPFRTLRLVTDPAAYQELTVRRARAADVPVEQVAGTGFFPAYRAPMRHVASLG
ncbi:MAG TPA: GNAT family N-acetyltransferase [Methylomirabilota bacterium]|nr:GNAT family N-acetyltransferase [Methylomirabilota bacterium]